MKHLKVWIALQNRDNALCNVMKRSKEEISNYLLVNNRNGQLDYYDSVAEVDISYEDDFELLDMALHADAKKDFTLGHKYQLYSVEYNDDTVMLKEIQEDIDSYTKFQP